MIGNRIVRTVAAAVVLFGVGAYMGIASPFGPHHSAPTISFQQVAHAAALAGPGTNTPPSTTDNRKALTVHHSTISACSVGNKNGFPVLLTKSDSFTYAPAAESIQQGHVYRVAWISEVKPYAKVIIAAKVVTANLDCTVPTVTPSPLG